MTARVLSITVIVGNGTVAGVLFAVAVSVMPALLAMPSDRYVQMQRLLGRNWDPTMPVIVLSSILADVALAILAPTDLTRIPSITAAILLVGVALVSHLCNVPINRRLGALNPEAIPSDWDDPRLAWRNWNIVRTVLALTALALNGLGATLT